MVISGRVYSHHQKRPLKVAIIGGGPGGLGAALEMAKLPFIEWNLYEKKPAISETGGGISLQPNTWRLLQENGAAKYLSSQDFFRPQDGMIEQRRNGRDGKLLYTKNETEDLPSSLQTCRLLRAKLQTALLRGVDKSHIHVGMRLVSIEHLPNEHIRISFSNGFVDEVDLLIGADGIRSLVRHTSFPDYKLRYSGRCVYRTIVSKREVMKIENFPWTPTFWKHTSGLYVFTCPLGHDDFEVTARIRRPDYDVVSWGRPFDLRALLDNYSDFCAPVQRILRLAADGETQEFALFSGQRLPQVVAQGNIALIGDASHPMSGNFGAGCGFALEDVYALTRALEWAWSQEKSLSSSLKLFDSIRSPHYKRLYALIDRFAAIKSALLQETLSVDDEIRERVERISLASQTWMYHIDMKSVVMDAIEYAEQLSQLDGTIDVGAAGEVHVDCVEPPKDLIRAVDPEETMKL